jgi:hypothetical protein
MRLLALFGVLISACAAAGQVNDGSALPDLLPGFHRSPYFNEQVFERWLDGGVRVFVNAPETLDRKRPTRLVIYATPNGNTIEQTLGCKKADGLDWHFDIQHVGAQVRRWRALSDQENIVVAVVEAEGLSWPAWRRATPQANDRIRKVIDRLRELCSGSPRVTLTGHSGGGSFIFGLIESGDSIPDFIDRIAFLDANYSFDADKHTSKFVTWLNVSKEHRLSVIAYDDREIMLDGKRVIGKDGGTFRATRRMIDAMGKDIALTEGKSGDFVSHAGLDGRVAMYVHPNPQNRILHTALVGEMNGLLQVLAGGSDIAWGKFGGPQAYEKWIQPAPGIPPRAADAVGGSEFFKKLSRLTATEREQASALETLRGNIPDFLRTFAKITVKSKDKAGKEHTATYEVMPDYLAIGANTDFVRVPMRPMTAQCIADAFGCSLPTRKIVDDVYNNAMVKLDPVALTEAREATDTFLHHNSLIEKQRAGKVLGQLIAGIKKDVVVTNRLDEKPNRVAIYGWHKSDGKPIQPLTIIHRDTYVDYSHGTRLVRRTVMVDGKAMDIRHVLHAAELCDLLSDEGPILRAAY